MNKRPELLLPVGTSEMAHAAIHNGADAIYMGMPGFNARGRSKDFSIPELKAIINECHLFGVKVHLAFNILIFENEIKKAINILKEIIPLGVDAIIVQDMGLVKIIKSIYPNQVVHGSTQMTVTNQDAIELLDDLDIKRFVLGRENSIDEIKLIKDSTDRELEVFVHGALCVAYSGQCLTSESIGGRSANRGQCAQSCRFSYEMKVDGKRVDLKDKKYLVSPKDLCGIEEIPALIDIGVDSFKVEGRLKSAEYVASAASSYSKAINSPESKVDTTNMELSFSRGFFKGWLGGVSHQNLVEGSSSSKRGIFVGLILSSRKNIFTIDLDRELTNGAGLMIVTEFQEIGAQIYSIKHVQNNMYEISVQNDVNLDLFEKAKVYYNSDPKRSKEIEKSFTQKDFLKKIPVTVNINAQLGDPLELTVSDDSNTIVVKSESLLEESKTPTSIEKLKSSFKAFGLTPFTASIVSLSKGIEGVFINNKDIKMLKRKAAGLLIEKRVETKELLTNEYTYTPESRIKTDTTSELNVLVRDISQITDIIEDKGIFEHPNLGSVLLDFEFGKDFGPAVEMLKEKSIKCGIATTRILKPKEYHNLNNILRAKPDYILVRNLGALNYIKTKAPEIELRGDFSLNISNSISAKYVSKKGLTSIVPSYDLNKKQLLDLISSSNEEFEVTLHHYVPGFHMEHCVYAAFLSKGNSFKDCGKPCEKHSVELVDQFGNNHFLHADKECRNTMFNANAQSLSLLLDDIIALNVSKFRFEALKETGTELTSKIKNYLNFLAGKIDTKELNNRLGIEEKYGLNTSRVLLKDSYQDRKK